MTVLSLTCGGSKPTHACAHPSCECACHAGQPTEKAEASLRRVLARDRVQEKLREFLSEPDLRHTGEAIRALQDYEQLLKEARHGR